VHGRADSRIYVLVIYEKYEVYNKMKIINTEFEGLKVIELEPHKDERGSFARVYCAKELKEAGINYTFIQDSISHNYKKNTIRGMHWQKEPYGEDKIVRCLTGAIYDVVIDLREKSSTYLKWFGIELTADNEKAIFVPKGFAHGFQTLEPNSTLYYKMSQEYVKKSGKGIRYDDKKIGVKWINMTQEPIVSEQDLQWELL